ncbi:MAG TPA: hypothetical protein VMT17_11850 [Anaeromyxobacteraceae bacterium]|nr:hypothetical protein [Anaeromyxobacteraceae bacterium]
MSLAGDTLHPSEWIVWVQIHTSGLPAGTYTDEISVWGLPMSGYPDVENSPQSISVTLSILP